MGYRSDVRSATTREGYERICRCVDELAQDSEIEQLIGTKVSPHHFEEYAGSVVFGWDFVKWYVGVLDDVTNVTKALSELATHGIPYEFCRIGESWDDIEFRTSCNNEELAVHVEPSVAIEIV